MKRCSSPKPIVVPFFYKTKTTTLLIDQYTEIKSSIFCNKKSLRRLSYILLPPPWTNNAIAIFSYVTCCFSSECSLLHFLRCIYCHKSLGKVDANWIIFVIIDCKNWNREVSFNRSLRVRKRWSNRNFTFRKLIVFVSSILFYRKYALISNLLLKRDSTCKQRSIDEWIFFLIKCSFFITSLAPVISSLVLHFFFSLKKSQCIIRR